jgi:hypothetical protein
MIQISAQKGPFSIQFKFRNHDILYVAVPNDEGTYDGQVKIFGENYIDLTDTLIDENFQFDADNFYNLMKKIDEKT